MSPVQYLEKIGVLGPDVVAAHCIFVDQADRKTLSQRQVGCVHNPSSNMMIASGVAPVPEMRAAGIAVGLGTDGPAGSNNDLDLMEEIDLAAKLAKITKMDPLAMNAKAVVEMATIDGARALHMEKEIGSLEKGKKADVILISLDEPNAVPMYDVYAQLAYALKASDVETVIIGGRLVMRNRKLLTVNEQEAIAKAREYKKKIAASLGDELKQPWPHPLWLKCVREKSFSDNPVKPVVPKNPVKPVLSKSSPGGAFEISPALQRWVKLNDDSSPGGTTQFSRAPRT
jgi:5-methylthioadenosine/S-adenosylhomocysteine deaminase